MNANRRLEEFILKLNTRQNEAGHFDKANELIEKIHCNSRQINKDKFDNTNCNKQSYSTNNE